MRLVSSAFRTLRDTSVRSWCFLMMALAIMTVTIITSWTNEMHKASIDLSMNGSRVVYGLTTALSHYRFGSPLYTHYIPVLETFWTNETVTAHHVNALIAKAMAIDPKTLTPDRLHVGFGELDYDDKGVILWYLAAFHLFGTSFGAIYAFYFLLLGASIGVFWLAFRRDEMALALLPIYALVHMALCGFVLAANTNVMGTLLLGTRPFAMLGVLPALHLALLILRKPYLTRWMMAGMAAQIACLIFVITIRSSAQVELIFVCGIAVLAGLWHWWQRRRMALPGERVSLFKRGFLCIPLSICLGLVASIMAYNAAVPAEVREKALVGHLVWHNILGGFCLNPATANILFAYTKEYSSDYKEPPPPDALAYTSVAGYSISVMHQPVRSMAEDGPDKRNVQEYEVKARKLFWDVFQKNPRPIIKLFVVDKTQQLYLLMRMLLKQLTTIPLLLTALIVGLLAGSKWLRGLYIVVPLLGLGFVVCSIPAYTFVPSIITMYDYAPYFYLGFVCGVATVGAVITWLACRMELSRRMKPALRIAAPVGGVAALSLGIAGLLIKERLPTIGDTSTIVILTSTYGENVGAVVGSATPKLQHSCGGLEKCKYTVDADVLGDPKGGASKHFTVTYECTRDLTPKTIFVDGEAHNARIKLDCTPPKK